MLKRTFLSLISLAFVGRAFTAVTLPTCDSVKGGTFNPSDCTVSSADTTLSFCYNETDEKIYEVTSAFGCKQAPLGKGLYIFNVAESEEKCIPVSAGWAGSYYSENDCSGIAVSDPYTSGTAYAKIKEVKKVNKRSASVTDNNVLYICNRKKCKQADNSFNYMKNIYKNKNLKK